MWSLLKRAWRSFDLAINADLYRLERKCDAQIAELDRIIAEIEKR